MAFEETDGLFCVLRNDEGQYSIWPEGMDVPAGWIEVHAAAAKQEALAFIESEWKDMRPLSLQRASSS